MKLTMSPSAMSDGGQMLVIPRSSIDHLPIWGYINIITSSLSLAPEVKTVFGFEDIPVANCLSGGS